MEMFLMVVTVSLVGIIVTVGMFAAATRNDSEATVAGEPRVVLNAAAKLAPPQFFVEQQPEPAQPRVPIEVLLLQIERHVRLEQAAAESFLEAPTARSLHTRTTSPLVH